MDMFFKLATSLKKMHDQQVCHFDLKEDNIFLMNKYTPVLGDLGMAKSIQQAIDMNFHGGTPKYMGYMEAKHDVPLAYEKCKADIYSLGVIFYQFCISKKLRDYLSLS